MDSYMCHFMCFKIIFNGHMESLTKNSSSVDVKLSLKF